MKSIVSIMSLVIFVAISFIVTLPAGAVLQDLGTDSLGYRLIYDTDLDITWYDYQNNVNNWSNQVAWASGLTVTAGGNTYTDWRLSTAVDGVWSNGYDGTTLLGYNITTSELGHLFYSELGNSGAKDTSGNSTGCSSFGNPCLQNTGDFQNLHYLHYIWTETTYSVSPNLAFMFQPYSGNLTLADKSSGGYAMAVHPGMVFGTPVVPEPVSSVLFIVGGAALGFRRWISGA